MASATTGATDPLDLQSLIADGVARILADEDAERFRAWLDRSIERYASPAVRRIIDEPRARASLVEGLARTIWNATPLPGNGFEPKPLPEPTPSGPCPCGSRRRFGDCCGQVPAPTLRTEMIWPRMLSAMTLKEVSVPLGEGKVPAESLLAGADECLEQGKPGKAAALLETMFEEPIRRTDALADFARQRLCECYDRLGHHNKKMQLLRRVSMMPDRSPLRSGAWAHLATIELDQGNLDEARACFERAVRDGPGDPSLALLEIHLLVAEGDTHRAKSRAMFWLKQFERADFEQMDELRDAFHMMTEDPLAGLAVLSFKSSGYGGGALHGWIARLADRPLPDYRVRGFDDPVMLLEPLPATAAVERAWRRSFGPDKPFAIERLFFGDDQIWSREHEHAWVSFLEEHEEAFDSLEILDDLASWVLEHPDSVSDWIDHVLLEPILRRAEAIIERALEGVDRPHLPWSMIENRPVLRSLVRLQQLEDRCGNSERAHALARRVLELNPNDNHGLRATIVNHLLREGDDRKALALVERYPGDIIADTVYGRILALYRLGRRDEAARSLREAMQHFPLVPRYLVRASIRRPPIDYESVRVGGPDQAWLYREEMRETWQQTPGALEWLEATAAAVRRKSARR